MMTIIRSLASAVAAALILAPAYGQTLTVTIHPDLPDIRTMEFDAKHVVDPDQRYIGDDVWTDCMRWVYIAEVPDRVAALSPAEQENMKTSAGRCASRVKATALSLSKDQMFCVRDARYYGEAVTIRGLVSWMAEFKRKRPGGVGALPADKVYELGVKGQHLTPCVSKASDSPLRGDWLAG